MLELETTGLATGGEAVGRDAEGRTVFVSGALAQERVRVRVTEQKKRFARAELIEVIDASPDRIVPRCPEVANGCGGCDLAHASLDAQRQAKARMIVDAATRIGRLATVPPVTITPLDVDGFRTTLRAG
ncbi:MAG: TRAM domain-containing protein, partial [Actinobacteria bacterium]|nr:TRAM domain-containing protein [Actinomycetota bacterium]